MANQQLAVEPEAEAVTNPNDAPKGIIQQHREFVNSSNNIVFHLARSTTITLIVFFVGAFFDVYYSHARRAVFWTCNS